MLKAFSHVASQRSSKPISSSALRTAAVKAVLSAKFHRNRSSRFAYRSGRRKLGTNIHPDRIAEIRLLSQCSASKNILKTTRIGDIHPRSLSLNPTKRLLEEDCPMKRLSSRLIWNCGEGVSWSNHLCGQWDCVKSVTNPRRLYIKSVVVLAGAAMDLICRFGRYIFRAGTNYNGETNYSDTQTQCAQKYITYTHSLAVRYFRYIGQHVSAPGVSTTRSLSIWRDSGRTCIAMLLVICDPAQFAKCAARFG